MRYAVVNFAAQQSLYNFRPLKQRVFSKKISDKMGIIKDRFKEKADSVAAEIKDILKDHGTKKIGEVQLAQIYQGMRGMTGLVSETSLLDAQEGIRFRGYSIPELQAKLPKADGGSEPLPEGLFHLMLVGDLPTDEDAQH